VAGPGRPTNRVAWLHTLDERDRDRAGGKAFTLARLLRTGLPVPEGFVLTAGATPDEPGWRDEVVSAYRELGGRVAVRSSSVREDGAQASFAGQFTTVLDVIGEEAVVSATRACLRAAGAGEAYARALGGAGGGPLAVLVQRFVPARVSGVVFTRDPRHAERLVVEAHPGRGDLLVGGRVTPERYELDRASGRWAESGGAGGSVDGPTLQAVAALALAAERLLGGAQDVEWALAEAGPVLLQSRPITTAAEEPLDPRLRRLTRANVGEVLPGPVTPLTWSTVGLFLERGFEAVADAAGVRPKSAPPFLVLHRRRLYLNLDAALEVATRLPGVDADEAERLVLGGGAAAQGPGRRRPRVHARGLLVLARTLAMAAGLPRAVVRAERLVAALPPRAAVAAESAAGLAGRLEELVAVGCEVGRTHIAVSGASAVRLAVVGRVLAALVPGDPVERLNRLVAAIDDVESAAPALALERLAGEVAAHPEWRAWIESAGPGFAPDLAAAPAALVERLDAFLARFGHRCLSEGELRARSWAEDPAPVIAAVQALLRVGDAPARRRRARVELRAADEQALAALGPLRRALVRALLRTARDGVRARERTKSLAIALVDHARAIVRGAARALAREGRLAAEDDVFFLSLDELRAALGGRGLPLGLLARRRRTYEREAALPVPREVDLRAEVPPGPAPDAVGAGGGDNVLQGLGVSPGLGAGPARVLAEGAAEGLQAGEVLVTPVLDAALGPMLATAAGVVAEVGGLLSHGAVVARELGVPCVVDVRDATRRIAAGEVWSVDGGTGRVRPLAGDAYSPALDPALVPAAPADEPFHPLAADPRARESVYFNAQDPARGVTLVASAGVRPGGRGEALAALGLPDGRVLFRLDRGRARFGARSLTVGATTIAWDPPALRLAGDFAPHEAADFPPGPVPLLLAPRTAAVALALEFSGHGPAFDLAAGLPERVRAAVAEMGSHHVEQSGDWRGELRVDGHGGLFQGTGSRDHTWGLRDWDAADHWRLFTLRLPGLVLHAMAASIRGRLVQGGFLWRDGVAAPVQQVEYAGERDGGRLRAFELEVASGRERLRLRGTVLRTITVPVQPARSVGRLLAGKPYRLLLHENFTRYEGDGGTGLGIAEFTERR
jgi:pyruvate,water dikinase